MEKNFELEWISLREGSKTITAVITDETDKIKHDFGMRGF